MSIPNTPLADSGQRETTATGAVREPRAGKGRFSLIPYWPLRLLALHYEAGADKYAPNNWRKGLNVFYCLDAVYRHLGMWIEGDRSENHLSAAAWNIFTIQWTIHEVEQDRLPGHLLIDPQDKDTQVMAAVSETLAAETYQITGGAPPSVMHTIHITPKSPLPPLPETNPDGTFKVPQEAYVLPVKEHDIWERPAYASNPHPSVADDPAGTRR